MQSYWPQTNVGVAEGLHYGGCICRLLTFLSHSQGRLEVLRAWGPWHISYAVGSCLSVYSNVLGLQLAISHR